MKRSQVHVQFWFVFLKLHGVYHYVTLIYYMKVNLKYANSFLEQVAPAVEYLIHSYPKYVTVESLPLPSIDQRVSRILNVSQSHKISNSEVPIMFTWTYFNSKIMYILIRSSIKAQLHINVIDSNWSF